MHYYLDDDSFPAVQQLNDMQVYLTGGQFPRIPGHYNMPFGEGQYTVYLEDRRLRMSMVTRGQAQPYTHDLKLVLTPDKVVRSGWYQWVMKKWQYTPNVSSMFRSIVLTSPLSDTANLSLNCSV